MLKDEEWQCPAQMYLHEGGYYDNEDGLTKLIDQNFMEQAPKALDKMILGDNMPEEVRQYFILKAQMDAAEQRRITATKERDDLNSKMKKIVDRVTQTGPPIVARMPNGDAYVFHQDYTNEPVVEQVQVVNL